MSLHPLDAELYFSKLFVPSCEPINQVLFVYLWQDDPLTAAQLRLLWLNFSALPQQLGRGHCSQFSEGKFLEQSGQRDLLWGARYERPFSNDELEGIRDCLNEAFTNATGILEEGSGFCAVTAKNSYVAFCELLKADENSIMLAKSALKGRLVET